ncbi:MAG: hypothetical protein ACO3U4_11225, partial [Gemmobacter sp.]
PAARGNTLSSVFEFKQPEGNTEKRTMTFMLGSSDAGFTFDFIDWNLFADQAAWLDATLGTTEERKAKLADPATWEGALAARAPDLQRRHIEVGAELERAEARWISAQEALEAAGGQL